MTGAEPHDRPDPVELVEAVRELLDTPGEEGPRERLHRRVASNVLATVARQLAADPADRVAHEERLAGLGVPDNRALAALAASLDEDDPRFEQLTTALAEWARAKLAVTNPRYLEDTWTT